MSKPGITFKIGLISLSVISGLFIVLTMVGQIREKNRVKAAEIVQESRKLAPRIAEFHLASIDVATAENTIIVGATAKIFETREAIKFLWRIQVKNAETGDVVSEKVYEDEMFNKDKIVNGEAFFADQATMPAGTYKVLLTLYEIPPGFDIGTLAIQQISDAQRVLMGNRTVTVRQG